MNPDKIKEWGVYLALYPNDNPSELYDSKPASVVVFKKETDSFITVIRITDLDNISDANLQKGIQIYDNTEEYLKMGLRKDSFINIKDYKTISYRNFIQYFGKCPNEIIAKIKELIV